MLAKGNTTANSGSVFVGDCLHQMHVDIFPHKGGRKKHLGLEGDSGRSVLSCWNVNSLVLTSNLPSVGHGTSLDTEKADEPLDIYL